MTLTVDTDGAAGAKTDTIVATAAHPFWIAGEAEWLDAADIQSDRDLYGTNGAPVDVLDTGTYVQYRRVYNLTISDVHTYYVLAGVTPVLVHNSGPDCGVPLGGKNGDRLGGEGFHGSEYSLDEVTQFVNGHTGDGNSAMGRPSVAEVEATLRQAGPRQLEGQNSSRFDYNGVRVIVNWDMPWKSTAYYPGR